MDDAERRIADLTAKREAEHATKMAREHIEKLKRELGRLSPPSRVQLRDWLVAHYDASGNRIEGGD